MPSRSRVGRRRRQRRQRTVNHPLVWDQETRQSRGSRPRWQAVYLWPPETGPVGRQSLLARGRDSVLAPPLGRQSLLARGRDSTLT